MIAPNLSERIAWYQTFPSGFALKIPPWATASPIGRSRPNIAAVSKSTAPHFGVVCAPLDASRSAKAHRGRYRGKTRAHIIIRTPENADDLAEVERTLLHELGHVLVAPMQSTNREAEENAMHSFDHFFSKLSPEQGAILARAMQNPWRGHTAQRKNHARHGR